MARWFKAHEMPAPKDQKFENSSFQSTKIGPLQDYSFMVNGRNDHTGRDVNHLITAS
jgi:hypothetical protein